MAGGGEMHLYRANWDVLRNLSRREKKATEGVQGKERQGNGERGEGGRDKIILIP